MLKKGKTMLTTKKRNKQHALVKSYDPSQVQLKVVPFESDAF